MKKLTLFLYFVIPLTSFAQDPARFDEEIRKFKDSTAIHDVVFTGSSSVRLWNSLYGDFPEVDLINTGFGGSEMSDLLFFIDELIIKYEPRKIFIYEGDNDLNSGKTVDQVMQFTTRVLDEIFASSHDAQVYFISAKPSPSRFALKEKYEELNTRFQQLSAQRDQVEFVDVWTPMLNEKDIPIPSIFIEDQLHMNSEGYAIWKEVIAPYLRD